MKNSKIVVETSQHLNTYMISLTQEDFERKMKNIHGSRINIKGLYNGSRYTIKVGCNACGHKWEPIAASIIRGHGCPECGKEKAKQTVKWKITQNEFIQKIPIKLRRQILILGTYQSVCNKLLIRCKSCGHLWQSKPCYLYKGQGCKLCGKKQHGIHSRKTHSQFVREVEKTHLGKIKVISPYITSDSTISVQCKICRHNWEPVAAKLIGIHFRGCPMCCRSKGELKIEDILQINKIPFLKEVTFPSLISEGKRKTRLRFDFGILNVEGKLIRLIEFDGPHHFQPLNHHGGVSRYEKQKENDQKKDTFCAKHNIPLTRIPFQEYKTLSLERLWQ